MVTHICKGCRSMGCSPQSWRALKGCPAMHQAAEKLREGLAAAGWSLRTDNRFVMQTGGPADSKLRDLSPGEIYLGAGSLRYPKRPPI